jgi:hypothetical protein
MPTVYSPNHQYDIVTPVRLEFSLTLCKRDRGLSCLNYTIKNAETCLLFILQVHILFPWSKEETRKFQVVTIGF